MTVSVLSIEGTDCRLDELGRLADRTGGRVRTGSWSTNVPASLRLLPSTSQHNTNTLSLVQVVIASPNRLHPEFEHIMDNRTVATHCAVTLLLPRAL